MNTPICDENKWDAADCDTVCPPRMVVDLEVAEKLETNLRRALEAWKAGHQRFMDQLFDEKGFFHNPECPVCKQIKELEELS